MQLSENIFSFLKELSKNNNRDWFSQHKKEYESARLEMEIFCQSVHNQIAKEDFLSEAKVYRIYRDIRFSKDKTPFKEHFGGYFARKQPQHRGGYYIHISPTENFIGGGFFAPNTQDLFRIRKEIELYPDEFQEIMNNEKIQKLFGDTLWGEELKTAPKGFDKQSPALSFLRKKQFLLKRDFTINEVLSTDFQEEVVKSFLALRPFYDFMTTALTTDLNGESIL
ncbi:MAG: DUF2461 domain-containing protein [Capnocytophaga sp.]|nr:DUF2461 domain-containing protein [Capnocytophaga sp.]